MSSTALRRSAPIVEFKTAEKPRPHGHVLGHLHGLAINVNGLSKSFGDNAVLKGVDLAVGAGEFVAIVGRSGCGKSTLLRLLLGLEQPSAGTFAFSDENQRIDNPKVARVMFQEPRLLPWASVIANVEVGLGPDRKTAGARERALATLSAVDLEEKRDAWPAVLSGGQKQRVSLARALVSRPRILALDEPLGALDALTRIEMQELIEQVWQDKGFTAIVVTHDVTEAVTLADRVLLLVGGGVALDLPVELPRPRRRGDPAAAAIEGRILDRLLVR